MQHSHTDLPHITATSIIECDGKFLMVVEEADGAIVINQPSGHVEPLESPYDACIRETLEETGWHYQPKAIVGIYYYHSDKSHITYQRICFCGDAVKPILQQTLDPAIQQVVWLTRNELIARQQQLRSPMVLRCIDDYLAGQRYPLDLITNLM